MKKTTYLKSKRSYAILKKLLTAFFVCDETVLSIQFQHQIIVDSPAFGPSRDQPHAAMLQRMDKQWSKDPNSIPLNSRLSESEPMIF